ncbi:hypothetical protein V4S33_11885 [Enterococcus cecorum]
MLSISGGGGNYPIQVSGAFFRWINPWLPFTYAVNLLREATGGIYLRNMWVDIIFLICGWIIICHFWHHLLSNKRRHGEKIQPPHQKQPLLSLRM